MKFAPKSAIVEAFKVEGAIEASKRDWKDGAPKWIRAACEKGKIVLTASNAFVETPEGNIKADANDWIVKGPNGELYPCKPEVLSSNYERIER